MRKDNILIKVAFIVFIIMLGVVNFNQIHNIINSKKQITINNKNNKLICKNKVPTKIRGKYTEILEILNKKPKFKIVDIHKENSKKIFIKVEFNEKKCNIYNDLDKFNKIAFFDEFSELQFENKKDDFINGVATLIFNVKG